MNFIGRKQELQVLEREYKRESGFVVVYGRRRVGKTTLIKEFIKDKKALYFLATEEMERDNMSRFAASLARFCGQEYLADVRYPDWESMFTAFTAYEPQMKKVLVIDEFQYLIGVNQAYASIFQRAWDEVLSKNNVMVILCGSLISMMTTHVLSYGSPLYGRRTSQIRLSPLSFAELREAWRDKSFEELTALYSVTGGVPKYLDFFENDEPLFENIAHEVFSKDGFLYEETAFLLDKEVNEPVGYFSIMRHIAAGCHKLGHIAGAVERPSNRLSPYLKTLMDLELVEKRIPVTEQNPEKSRKGLYYIKDNFVDFWFKFVAPCKGELELGNIDFALKRLEKSFIANHVSFVFEVICQKALYKLIDNFKIPCRPSRVGSWWDNANQIDVAGIDHETKSAILGECKFHSPPVDADVYFELVQKAKTIPELKAFSIYYLIFSKSGFTKRLLEVADNNKDVFLIDMNQV